MTASITFPAAPAMAYVEDRGGVLAVLDARGVEDFEERSLLGDYYSSVVTRAFESAEAPLAPAIGLHEADRISIDVFGVHPMHVWGSWFDIESNEPDYDDLEGEVLLGRFDSKAEFWQHVEDIISETLDKNTRSDFLWNLMPEARDYLATLPDSLTVVDKGLKVGDTCLNGHAIKTRVDLVLAGVVGMGCRQCRLDRRLAVGKVCTNGHKIESEDDLARPANPAKPPNCRQCRRDTVAARRANREGQPKTPHPRTKLTPENHEEIRIRLDAGESHASIAVRFGVARQTISKLSSKYQEGEAA